MASLALNVSLHRPAFDLRVEQTLALDGITALFGPSGAGKSTLLRVIAGLERAAHGTVSFAGDLWQTTTSFVPAHRRRVGYVFQDARLFAHLSVEENLHFALRRAAGAPTASLEATVEALELEDLRPRRTQELSGGERQRVAIARALLGRPRLLLMDEPLSSLDVARKREILPLIEQLPERFGVPVLYVTHNLDEVARLATDVVLLAAGRVAAYDRVASIFERTDLENLTGAIEAGVVLHARVAEHCDGVAMLAVGRQRLRVPLTEATVGSMRTVRIHARDVAIATLRPQQLSIRNILEARILRIDSGPTPNVDVLLDVDGERLRSRITRDAAAELGLAEGQLIFALVKSVALENVLLT